MWGMSYAKFMMYVASIPDYSKDDSEDKNGKKDKEEVIDNLNWGKYVSK